MTKIYDGIDARTKGAWVVHHGQKTAATINGSAEFPALDAAGKAASLLSQLAATDQTIVDKCKVNALAKAAGLNPRIELPELLKVLERRRLIQTSASGDVEVLGLTSAGTVQHAGDIFEEQDPTAEERASIALAELTSSAPVAQGRMVELISDEFKLAPATTRDFLVRSETVGFADAEGRDVDKLYFNGNIFRSDSLVKIARVLDSLSSTDRTKATELDNQLGQRGCLSVVDAEKVLGPQLFDKLKAAGMYDVNHVSNDSGEFGFVTRPAAFHKFNDPMVDDAFDLAKALVAALAYGMTLRSHGTGRIGAVSVLLNALISGREIGPATAIGEDYRVLEMKGVIQTRPGSRYGYLMKLKKKDIGQMALAVLTTGEASSTNALDRPFEGNMSGYAGPEQTRSQFRRKRQTPESKKLTRDVLAALRTG